MAWHPTRGAPRSWRVRRSQRLAIGNDLLGNGDVWISWEETTRTVQEPLRDPHRRDQYPIGPSLRHHRIRLHTIENLLPLLRGLVDLVRRGCTSQRLIDRLELLLQLFIFLLQLSQLHTRIFIFPERRNRTRNLLGIHLRQKICVDDYDIAVETGGDPLIEHQHQAGRIGSNFVFGHVHAVDNRHALQVRGNLFKRVPFGCLRRETDRIFASVAVTQAMFALGIDDSNFCKCGGGG